MASRIFSGLIVLLLSSFVVFGFAVPVSTAPRPAASAGDPPYTGTLYYSTAFGGKVASVPYTIDPIAKTFSLGSSATVIASLPSPDDADGIVFDPVQPNLLLVGSVGGGHTVKVVDINSHTFTTHNFGSTSTPYHMMADSNGNVWTSGIPGIPIKLSISGGVVTGGVSYSVTGDDLLVTTIAWLDNTHAFYTSSDASGSGPGHFGSITFSGTTATTTCAKLSGVCRSDHPAHGMVYDPYSNTIIFWGDSEISQIDLSLNVLSHLTVSGQTFDQGTVDGQGHLFIASNMGYFFFEDYTGHPQDIGNLGNWHTLVLGTPYCFGGGSCPDDIAPLPPLQGSHPSCPTPQVNWAQTWGGSQNDVGRGVAVNASGDGDIYVTGQTNSFGAGGSDIVLLKYDPTSGLIWQRTWGSPSDDVGTSVAVSGAYVYVAGYWGGYPYNASILKFDSLGNLIWQYSWGGSSLDQVWSVAVNGSFVYLAGTSYSSFIGGDAFLLKLQDLGSSANLIWQRHWGGTGNNWGYSVAVHGSYIYLSGTTNGFGAGSSDAFLLKFNYLGNLIWQRTWGGSNIDLGYGVAVDALGNIIQTGTTMSFGVGGTDISLVKWNSTGGIIWQKTWGGSGNDGVFYPDEHEGVAVDSFGNIHVTGSTQSFGDGSSDIVCLKFDSSGNLLGERTWGGNGTDVGYGVAADSSGDAIIAGYVSEPIQTAGVPAGIVTTPNASPGTPLGVVGVPSLPLSPATGVVSTPPGSTSYAGGEDLALASCGTHCACSCGSPGGATFLSNPPGGAIFTSIGTYTNGQSLNASTCGCFQVNDFNFAGKFVNWTTTGGVVVSNATSFHTTVCVNGPGTLIANFSKTSSTPALSPLGIITTLLITYAAVTAAKRRKID